ncbi:plasmid mobilization protein [Olivibacter sitiensis]|uniref:plasmid mobilization protein n=1 Tax=Olivibacter sitiensis TaxID=376470 RepID=UPI0004030F93|nr:plasmid mobilization relaxosome protein MobC [Olivibacter sitiensis]
MENNKTPKQRKGGRPEKESAGKRTAEIKIRCLAEEKNKIKSLSKSLGISITDYILKRALEQKIVVNYKEIHKELHEIGTEFSRAGNNINQLAKHANAMHKMGKLDHSIVERFSLLLSDYVKKKDEVRVVLRKVIRELLK